VRAIEAPKIRWLQAFVETASTGSFAHAAVKLGVTPGVISHNVKALESFLTVDLLHRQPQGVELTDAGKRYAQRILPLLAQVIEAADDLVPANTSAVRVATLPALAQLWLGPRLEDFHTRHPEIAVEIHIESRIAVLPSSNFDIAIRYGETPVSNYQHWELLFDELVPVASPGLLATAVRDDAGLPIDVPLMLDMTWSGDLGEWLSRTGQGRSTTPSRQGFSLYAMAVDAVLQGRGFMIARTALVGDLIDQGRLRALSDRRVAASEQIYLVSKSARSVPANVALFTNWLIRKAALS
jgi:LysR family glycine cleavage system transcriptional activator